MHSAGSRAHGLSCPIACGILVPQPEIEPMSPTLQSGFLTIGPLRQSPHHYLDVRLGNSSSRAPYYPYWVLVFLVLSKLREVVEDREAWPAAVRGITKSHT